jgi:hypothetical protein
MPTVNQSAIDGELEAIHERDNHSEFFVPTRALPLHSLLPAHRISRKLVANFARSVREDLNLKAADLRNRSALHVLLGKQSRHPVRGKRRREERA